MNRRFVLIVAIVSLSVVITIASMAAKEKEPQRIYQGVANCKKCHKQQGGETGLVKSAYTVWAASPHAKAYETLGTDKAKKIAKEKGLGDPQKAEACLKCHVTGHGVAAKFLGKDYKVEDGVGCEACHGAGGDYYTKKVMKAVASGETKASSVGLIKPDKIVCQRCHNPESPTFKKFDYDKRVKEIAHPVRVP